MSVPKPKRHLPKEKLEVEAKTDELAAYVFKITNKEENFPKRHRYSIATPILAAAVNASRCVTMANSYRLDNEEEAKKRLSLQRDALAYTYEIEKLALIAYENIKGFPEEKIEVLGDHLDNVRNHIHNWIRSDKTRQKDKTG